MIWYLIFTFRYTVGAVVIPQVSHDQCVADVNFLRAEYPTGYAVCIPGAPNIPLSIPPGVEK